MSVQGYNFERMKMAMAYCQETVVRLAIVACVIQKLNLQNKNQLIAEIAVVAECHIHVYKLASFGADERARDRHLLLIAEQATKERRPELNFKIAALMMELMKKF